MRWTDRCNGVGGNGHGRGAGQDVGERARDRRGREQGSCAKPTPAAVFEVERPQSREAALEAGRLDLEDPDSADVLQAAPAERTEDEPVAFSDELLAGVGQEDLPAVARRRDARGAMNRVAGVAVEGECGRAGVHADPDADAYPGRPGLPRQRALSFDGREDRVPRRIEGDEERVSLRIDLPSAMGRERFSEEALMLDEDVAVVVTKFVEQPR